MRASRGLKWENKMYKLKRSILSKDDQIVLLTHYLKMFLEVKFLHYTTTLIFYTDFSINFNFLTP